MWQARSAIISWVKSGNLAFLVALRAAGFFAPAGLLSCAAALFEGARRAVGFAVPASVKVSFAAITALLFMCNQAEASMQFLGRCHSSSTAAVHRSLRVRVAAACHASRSKPRRRSAGCLIHVRVVTGIIGHVSSVRK